MGKMVLIGFDLDGTIAETNTSILGLIDRAKVDDADKLVMYEIFYRNVKPIFSVREFMHEKDEGIIITARNPDDPLIKKITERWAAKYFPEFRLIMVGNDELLKKSGKWLEWQEDIVERKTKVIKAENVYIYFDDSPTIVDGLRDNGIHAMQFGGRL